MKTHGLVTWCFSNALLLPPPIPIELHSMDHPFRLQTFAADYGYFWLDRDVVQESTGALNRMINVKMSITLYLEN